MSSFGLKVEASCSLLPLSFWLLLLNYCVQLRIFRAVESLKFNSFLPNCLVKGVHLFGKDLSLLQSYQKIIKLLSLEFAMLIPLMSQLIFIFVSTLSGITSFGFLHLFPWMVPVSLLSTFSFLEYAFWLVFSKDWFNIMLSPPASVLGSLWSLINDNDHIQLNFFLTMIFKLSWLTLLKFHLWWLHFWNQWCWSPRVWFLGLWFWQND